MANTGNYTEVNMLVIERCKRGERKAFHELYELYKKAMFNVALRILNNSSEAEDVLQESFLKAFAKINTYNQGSAFGAWLKRIVINTSLDALKKRKLQFVPLDQEHYNQEEEGDEDIDLEVENIKNCVRQLPDGYRSILSLYLFEDYSHKEIAALLNISEGTSKSQYNRAKKKLIDLVKQRMTINER